MKYLSLDFGTKRIGVAYADTDVLANEYTTLMMDKWPLVMLKILSILEQEKVETLIIGLPKNMDGTESKYSLYVRDYTASLIRGVQKRQLPTKVILEDERLTSAEAERQLREQGHTQDEIKKRSDQYAAKLILEQYLENK